MPRLYFALDLHDDPSLIAEYERWHEPNQIWPEILKSLRTAGIREAEIFRTGNRLVLVLEVSDDFDVDAKAAADAADPRVAEWEALMWRYQKALPWADPEEKWVPMKCIFRVSGSKD